MPKRSQTTATGGRPRYLANSLALGFSLSMGLHWAATGALLAEGEVPADAPPPKEMLAAREHEDPQRSTDLAKLDPEKVKGAAAAAAAAAVEEMTNQEAENAGGAASAQPVSPPMATPPEGANAINQAPVPVDMPVPVELTEEMKKLAQERLKLELEYTLRMQELRNKMADLEIERLRLDTEMGLANSRQMKELQQVDLERRKLQADNVIVREKLQQESVNLGAQKENMEAHLALDQQKLSQELATVEAATAKVEAEKAKLVAEQELAATQSQAQISSITAERARLEAEMALAQAKMQKDLEGVRQAKERMAEELAALEQRVALAEARTKEAIVIKRLAKNDEYQQYLADKRMFEARSEARQAEMVAMETEAKIRQTAVDYETAFMKTEITREEQRKTYDDFVYQEIEYKKDPFKDGILYVTDRRIPMNDVIIMPTADYVTSMIDYFNNKSTEYPIFIVIDNCPGGSVMAGYRILKAMQGSKAPVYVVVKSYAASMAATITTMAPRSFVYPNAIIHHHQMLYGSQGNMTQQQDALKEAQEWWQRLASPVAEKMGITLEDFTKRMYKRNADGEWFEFGTEAVKLKWADTTVEEIREVGTSKKPDEEQPPVMPWFAVKEEQDASGKAYKKLPQLGAFDAWYLTNKDSYYRFQ